MESVLKKGRKEKKESRNVQRQDAIVLDGLYQDNGYWEIYCEIAVSRTKVKSININFQIDEGAKKINKRTSKITLNFGMSAQFHGYHSAG